MNCTPVIFRNTTFDVVDRNGLPWLRQSEMVCALYDVQKGEVGKAPSFNNAEKSLKRLYERNADEFTDAMTALVELETNGGKQKVRIFSLRGCHLLAMFARTKVAKEFRKWVLDILDRETQLPNNSQQLITPTQIEELKDFHEQLIRSLPKLTINPPAWTKPDPAGAKDSARNIEVAQKLIMELKVWCHELPAEAGLPLWDALDDLAKLLITGSTEVSEALMHIGIATRYLNRWMGRSR